MQGENDPGDVWRAPDWRTMPPPEAPAPSQPWASPTYPPPPPYLPSGPAAERPQDGVSIAGFVTGLLGIVLVSVVLSIVGLTRTAGGQRRGRGFAVAGLVLSVAWAAVIAVFVPGWIRSAQPPPSTLPVVAASHTPSPTPATAQSPSPSARPSPTGPRKPQPAPVPARKKYVDELRTGNCLVVAKLGDSVLKVPVVPCRQAHDAEVVGVARLPGRWHGKAALDDVSDSTCSKLFRRYVGVDVDSSDHGLGWFGPTPESWKDGDRLVVCYSDEGGITVTGSVKGTGT